MVGVTLCWWFVFLLVQKFLFFPIAKMVGEYFDQANTQFCKTQSNSAIWKKGYQAKKQSVFGKQQSNSRFFLVALLVGTCPLNYR